MRPPPNVTKSDVDRHTQFGVDVGWQRSQAAVALKTLPQPSPHLLWAEPHHEHQIILHGVEHAAHGGEVTGEDTGCLMFVMDKRYYEHKNAKLAGSE